MYQSSFFRLVSIISFCMHFVIGLNGWKRRIVLFAAGVLSALGFAPLFLWPLTIIGIMILFWLASHAVGKKEAFATGWWFGFGHFIMGLYWIAIALTVEGSGFMWLVPFAVCLLPAGLAFFFGFMTLAFSRFSLRTWRSAGIFTLLWVAMELIRAEILTGFPWNLVGYVWSFSDAMIQLASITGVWGLSALTVAVSSLCAVACYDGLRVRQRIAYVSVAFVSVLLVFSYGAYRLPHFSLTKEFSQTVDESSLEELVPLVEGVKLRLVQPNIKQSFKWDGARREEIMQTLYQYSLSEGFDRTTHLIWPETSIPYAIDSQKTHLKILARLVPKNGALITGAMRARYSNHSDFYGAAEALYNSLIVIEEGGKVASVYNKHHLVPFGEYVPFKSFLPIKKITYGMMDFTAGVAPQTLSASSFVSFSPLICYEGIFPDGVKDALSPPEVLINVTNDGWYGNSFGPYQHMEAARMRSVEQGTPLIRVANTGISLITDAYGRVIAHLDLETAGILDASLPKALINRTTYSHLGRFVILSLSCIMLLFLFFWPFRP